MKYSSICVNSKAINSHDTAYLKWVFFGSAVRDDMTAESDIDIVVELGKTDLFYLIGIKQELEERDKALLFQRG